MSLRYPHSHKTHAWAQNFIFIPYEGRPLRHRRRHPTSHSVSAVDAIETATKRKRHLAAVRTIAVAALAQAEHRAVDLPARANTCVAAEDVVARLIRYAAAVVAVVCHRRHVAAAEVRASEQRKVARPNIVLGMRHLVKF